LPAAREFHTSRLRKIDGRLLPCAQSGAQAMSAVQTIRAKSGASSQKARATASDDEDSDDVAPASDDAVEHAAAKQASPPPGMGKLVDRTV
jgi:hypothetical protein